MQCGKISYTQKDAKKAARALQRRSGILCVEYKCRICSQFHITRKTRKHWKDTGQKIKKQGLIRSEE